MKSNVVRVCKLTESSIDDVLDIERSQDVQILTHSMLETSLKLPNSIYYVAKIEDEIVGYIGATLLFDHIDIESIVVKKEYKRNGIATLLLNHLFSFASKNNINEIFLEVRISNIPARRLYEKIGFKNISLRKNYYTNLDKYEDAAVYLLRLENNI